MDLLDVWGLYPEWLSSAGVSLCDLGQEPLRRTLLRLLIIPSLALIIQ